MLRSIGLLLLATAGFAAASVITLQSGSTAGESVMVNGLNAIGGSGMNCSIGAPPATQACGSSNPSTTSFSAGTIDPLSDVTPSWASAPSGASWISFEDTGWNGTNAVNTVSDSGCSSGSTARAGNCQPNAEFFQTFTDTSMDLILSLTVWADDTAAVYLDGTLILSPGFMQGSTACSGGVVTCSGAGATYTSPSGLLTSGVTHTLEFDVYQTGGWTYGLLYNGTVTGWDAPPPVPEPATFALLGGGLTAIGLIRRKRIF